MRGEYCVKASALGEANSFFLRKACGDKALDMRAAKDDLIGFLGDEYIPCDWLEV